MFNCACFKSYSTGSDTVKNIILGILKNREVVINLYFFLSPSWTIKEWRIKLKNFISLIPYLCKNEHYWNILKSTFKGEKNLKHFYGSVYSLLDMSIGVWFKRMMFVSAWLLPVGSGNCQIKNVIIECNYFNFSSTVCLQRSQLYSKLMKLTLVMNT